MPGDAVVTGVPTGQSGFTPAALAPREWLFCIPVQVGPATAYARNIIHWLFFILVIQAVLCFLRFVVLLDFTGGLWMALVIGLGLYAYKQDMNITYVCCWGLACAFNGAFDVLALVVPWIFGLSCRSLLSTLVLIAAPFGYLMGALFAWHLYHDYEEQRGHKLMFGGLDPLGKFINKYDPEKIPLAAAQRFDKAAGTKTAGTVDKMVTSGGAAAAAGGGFLGGLFMSSSAKAAASQGQAMGQQGLDAASAQAANAAEMGRGYAAQGQDAAQQAAAQGQQALASGQQLAAQKQEEAKGWFGSVQTSTQTMFDRAQVQAQDAAAGAAADASRKAVAEGVQKGKDQASGFFSSFMGSAKEQGAALQQQGAALGQQGAAQAASLQKQGAAQAAALQQQGTAQAAALQQQGQQSSWFGGK